MGIPVSLKCFVLVFLLPLLLAVDVKIEAHHDTDVERRRRGEAAHGTDRSSAEEEEEAAGGAGIVLSPISTSPSYIRIASGMDPSPSHR